MKNMDYIVWIEAEEWSGTISDIDDMNTDVTVTFEDESKWIASFITYKNMYTLVEKYKGTGEYLGGKYFDSSNMIFVDECSRKRIEELIAYFIQEGQFDHKFSECDDIDYLMSNDVEPNTDQTKVMAYFMIYGDKFLPDNISSKLGITPTKQHLKGDIISPHPQLRNSRTMYRNETVWELSTGYQNSYDINDQINELLDSLESKQNALLEIKRNKSTSFMFMIVIQVRNEETPATYLKSRFLNFATAIGAEIHFDLYVSN
ncbi:DUF4279 domain-containing protein [Paenibacillus radicis (ex Gao et al. 2016)]|uniref:DUF4279 domain-containing protein n=1 Tax=Paenibacillus radicis (ex Gao et al. 2016) TaxID=1737354 RepID=A0A917HG95_9BACL|nr:DUF4279 domain-containing protein [Paenibacillus radicis (ex Gao et al. 2016)]GGG78247.1 hypothetical protein GCM10010918_38910 [Paenibacillus radicis (ex Gao et al. 2016)]